MLKLLFAHEDLVEWAAARLSPEWINHPAVREIISLRFAAHANQSWISLGAFLEGCATAEQRQLITEVTAAAETWPDPAKQLADVLVRLRNAYIDKQSAALLSQIDQAAISDQTREQLILRREGLRLAKRQPLASLGEA